MVGDNQNNRLVGVMGIQKLKDITLIRLAYILTSYQGTSVGKSLLKYQLEINQNACLLVETWAIQFYENLALFFKRKNKLFIY